ncbi:phage major tail tube protein [Methylobacillus glycogenes]|uniref:phage major tail tube protein n=1 Tax=Methylobacillus glycogenes TaxID=406 RepID=UPI001F1AC74D|nr:phage major tail tube protein [Methylobacillus glycogenes]
MLPSILKDFNLFNDAQSYQGRIDEIILPTLSRKLEEYQGGGMVGPVDIDLGQEKLDLEWTVKGFDLKAMQQYGYVGVAGVGLRFNGAYQEDENCSIKAVEISVRGRHVSIESGSAKKGETNANTKVKSNLSYYKLTVDGEEIIELDLINYVYKVNGVDQLKDMRAAIGL